MVLSKKTGLPGAARASPVLFNKLLRFNVEKFLCTLGNIVIKSDSKVTKIEN